MFVFSLCFGKTGAGIIGSPATFGFFQNVDGGPLTHVNTALASDNEVLVSDIPGLTFAGYQGVSASRLSLPLVARYAALCILCLSLSLAILLPALPPTLHVMTCL